MKILRDSQSTGGGSSLPANQQKIIQGAQDVVNALSPLLAAAGPYGALVSVGANAVLTFAPAIMAEIESLFASGEITAEQQQAVLAAFNSLQASLPTLFQGPEWQQQPVPGQPS